MLLAATMQSFVPRATLLALAFAGTFGVGPVLAFLVYGTMIDIKSTLMLLRVFQRRAVAIIVLFASIFISYTWG
jgi:uncharacterized membrane protein YraQ (UPF0718 family)